MPAPAARTRSDGAVQSRNLRAWTSALATAAPTRRPVKLPGPSDTTTAVRSSSVGPALAKTVFTIGRSDDACRRAPATLVPTASASDGPTATDARSVAVSRARSIRAPRARADRDRRDDGAGIGAPAQAATLRRARAIRPESHRPHPTDLPSRDRLPRRGSASGNNRDGRRVRDVHDIGGRARTSGWWPLLPRRDHERSRG